MKFNIDFVSKFKLCVALSVMAVIGSLWLFFSKGLNYGVDFRGGAEIQVRFEQTVKLEELRSAFSQAGLAVSQVQTIGEESQNEFLLKMQTADGEDLNTLSSKVGALLSEKFKTQNPEILKNDIVGPKAGAQLRISGFQALAWAILGIMIYIALRFDFKFAPGAIAALVHDTIIIIGAFVITQKEFSLQIVAALLAIIGYSVNDTVVVYDRVRELELKNPLMPGKQLINQAINQTLARTILTSATTLLVAIVMFVMGGGVIHDFFFAISLGIVVGTYSTIYIAVPMTVYIDKNRNIFDDEKNKTKVVTV